MTEPKLSHLEVLVFLSIAVAYSSGITSIFASKSHAADRLPPSTASGYSIWLLPSTPEPLTTLLVETTSASATKIFPPHVTLLGGFTIDESSTSSPEGMISLFRTMISDLPSLPPARPLNFEEVKIGPTHFHSVFSPVSPPTPCLLSLRSHVLSHFSSLVPPAKLLKTFTPHLSLCYVNGRPWKLEALKGEIGRGTKRQQHTTHYYN